MEKQLSCEERIDSALASRLADINPDFNTMSLNAIKDYCSDYTVDVPEGIVYYENVAFDSQHNTEDIIRGHIRFNDDEVEFIEPLDFSDEIEQWIEFAEEIKEVHSNEMVLCVEEFKTVKILLSTGGPEDYFEVQYNDDGIIGGRYFFKDGFDVASRYVSAEQADDIINGLGIYLEGIH